MTFVANASAMTVTSTADSGTCTLRGAIQAVASNTTGGACGDPVTGGPTPINLPAGIFNLTSGELEVPSGVNVVINGSDPNHPSATVLDAGNASRVLEVDSGATVTLSGVTVTHGHTADAGTAPSTGSMIVVDNGGGILNKGTLTVDHSVVTANSTGHGSLGHDPVGWDTGGVGGWGGSGGGIFNDNGAHLTITNSTISNNYAGDGGNGVAGLDGAGSHPYGTAGGNGGPAGSGGGIFNGNSGTLSIDKSTISGNQTGRGGSGGQGGASESGDYAVDGADGGDGGNNGKQYRTGLGTYRESTFGGGGIASYGSLTMTDSTVSNNNTGAGGMGGASGAGGTSIVNIELASGNAGSGGGGGRGGGILVGGTTSNTSLTNVTIAQNLTGDGGTGGTGGGGGNSLGGAVGGWGGDGAGIYAEGASSGSTSLNHVTIANNALGGAGAAGASPNSHSAGPGGRGQGGGIASGLSANTNITAVKLKNSVVASNANYGLGDANCFSRIPGDIGDQGHNVSYGTVGTVDNSCPGDTGNPALGPLQNNGGPTKTMLPGAGSNLIAQISPCDISTDQRGQPRPGGGNTGCDIGAVESGGSSSKTPTTTSLVSSSNPSRAGIDVVFTATVSPSPSGGGVTFTDGGTAIPGCSSTVLKAGGQFTCVTSFPAVSTHSIVASYSGDAQFSPSISTALTQTVTSTTGPTGTTGTTSAGKSRVSGTTVALPLTCAGSASVQCLLTVRLGAVVLSGGKSSAASSVGASAKKKKKKKVTVGSLNVTLTGGQSKTIKVKLNRKGKGLLKKSHKLKVTMTVSQKVGTASKTILKKGLTFKSKKKKKKR